jgi:hypothetical protein
MDKKHKYMADWPEEPVEDPRDIYRGPETIDDTELYITISKSIMVDDQLAITRNLVDTYTGENLVAGHLFTTGRQERAQELTDMEWFEDMHKRAWESYKGLKAFKRKHPDAQDDDTPAF